MHHCCVCGEGIPTLCMPETGSQSIYSLAEWPQGNLIGIPHASVELGLEEIRCLSRGNLEYHDILRIGSVVSSVINRIDMSHKG